MRSVVLILEKLLSQMGLGSRKECRLAIRQGLVEIDGMIQDNPSLDLQEIPSHLNFAGESLPTQTRLYIMLNKPEGYECSHRPQHHQSVFNLLPERFLNMDVHCVGRLDVDTTGLLLFSNQGGFIHHVESPRKGLGKTYRARLADHLNEEQADALLAGVQLRSEKGLFTAKALYRIEDNLVDIVVGEGVYHQVKRMFAAVGAKVVSLHRLSIGTLELDAEMVSGSWRFLNTQDLAKLSFSDEAI